MGAPRPPRQTEPVAGFEDVAIGAWGVGWLAVLGAFVYLGGKRIVGVLASLKKDRIRRE